MSDEQEHGPQSFYASDGERYQPVMECLCTWSTGRQLNWEEAGAEFDKHLEDVKRGSGPTLRS